MPSRAGLTWRKSEFWFRVTQAIPLTVRQLKPHLGFPGHARSKLVTENGNENGNAGRRNWKCSRAPPQDSLIRASWLKPLGLSMSWSLNYWSDMWGVVQLASRGVVADVFSLCFGGVEGDGALMLGDVDPGVYGLSIAYTPLVPSPEHPHYYCLQLDAVAVDSTVLPVPAVRTWLFHCSLVCLP